MTITLTIFAWNFFRGFHNTELHIQQLKRRVMVSRPRKNQRKILKKFSAYAIFEKPQKMGSNLFFLLLRQKIF